MPSEQRHTAPSPSNKKLFHIVASHDGMQASIPAKTPIDPSVANLNYNQICSYLVKLGYAAKPTQESFEEIIKCSKSKNRQFDSDFILLKGSPYTPAKPATIKWLNPSTMPKDLIRPGIPFGIIRQATTAAAAKNIFGQELPMEFEKEEEKKTVTITTHPNFIVDKNGEMKCDKAGQALILHDGKIEFSEVYTVNDVRADSIHKVDFPCSVLVKCELQGALEWNVQGDLTVEQFWTSHGIKVKGNAFAKSGIQTNFPQDELKAIQIQGNLEAVFIQSSCLIVEGNIKVEKAILSSYLTVNGNLECLGDPGKITGSDILMKKGTINANSIGSEKDKPAYIKFLSEDGSNSSKIATVSEGTRLKIRRSNIIIKFTQPWPPPKT